MKVKTEGHEGIRTRPERGAIQWTVLEQTGCGENERQCRTKPELALEPTAEAGGGVFASSRSKLLPQRLERDAIKFHGSSPGEVLNPKLNLTRRAKEDTNVI